MIPRTALRPWASAISKPVIGRPSARTIISSLSVTPSFRPPPQVLRLLLPSARNFSVSPISQSWLAPRRGHKGKTRKGRPRVRTGGSTAGTTMLWGDYGLRMCDHDRRVSAAQLQIGWNTIRQRLRGLKFRMIPRVAADRAVFVSGNEQRMGKGKGSFDHYASRIAVNHMIFELKGDVHEKVIRDAFRLAGNKMPGKYEFVKKGDPPVMGLTKVMEGMTLESISRPWLVDGATTPSSSSAISHSSDGSGREPPRPKEPLETTANRIGSTTPS